MKAAAKHRRKLRRIAYLGRRGSPIKGDYCSLCPDGQVFWWGYADFRPACRAHDLAWARLDPESPTFDEDRARVDIELRRDIYMAIVYSGQGKAVSLDELLFWASFESEIIYSAVVRGGGWFARMKKKVTGEWK